MKATFISKSLMTAALAAFTAFSAISCQDKPEIEPEQEAIVPEISFEIDEANNNTHTVIINYTIFQFPQKEGTGDYIFTLEGGTSSEVEWDFYNDAHERPLAGAVSSKAMKVSVSETMLSNSGKIVLQGTAGEGTLNIWSVIMRTKDGSEYTLMNYENRVSIDYAFTDVKAPTDGYGKWDYASVSGGTVDLAITFPKFEINYEFDSQWFKPMITVSTASGHPLVTDNVKLKLFWGTEWVNDFEFSFEYNTVTKMLQATDWMQADPGVNFTAKLTGLPEGCTFEIKNLMQRYYNNQNVIQWTSKSLSNVKIPLTPPAEVAITGITLDMSEIPASGIIEDGSGTYHCYKIKANVTPSNATERVYFEWTDNLAVKSIGNNEIIVYGKKANVKAEVTVHSASEKITDSKSFVINENPDQVIKCYVDDVETFSDEMNLRKSELSFDKIEEFSYSGSIPGGAKKAVKIHFPEPVTRIARNAFNNRSSLKAIELPSKVQRIESGAFYVTPNLREVKLNEGLKVIEANAFLGKNDGHYLECDTFTFPSTVEEIHRNAFTDLCAKTVVLPASLKWIGSAAFYDCGRISTIDFKGEVPPTMIDDGLATYTFIYRHSVEKVYVPKGTLAAYKAAFPFLASKMKEKTYVIGQ